MDELLQKGLTHLIKNKEITIKTNIIVFKNNRFKLESPFALPFSNRRFNLFYLNNKNINIQTQETKSSLILLLADTKTFNIEIFCVNNLKFCQTGKNLQKFIKRKFGNNWKLNYISPTIRQKQIEEPLIKRQLKPQIKNLLWTFFYIDLKLFNPEFTNHILLEYLENNIEKRDIESILKKYYEKIIVLP
jgi:hypothetical protein